MSQLLKNPARLQPALPGVARPTKHPARYSDPLFRVFLQYLEDGWVLLDPMAGTGKLARLKKLGWVGTIVCNELEPEWATFRGVDEWHFGDAAHMEWAGDGAFDALVFSPTYGNRMADKYVDESVRHTYPAGLGRALSPESTAAMQWGQPYRNKHTEIYRECVRVLRSDGILICNVSNHIRDHQIVSVAEWHLQTLLGLGLEHVETHTVPTARNRNGANHQARVDAEFVYVLRKPLTNSAIVDGNVLAHPISIAEVD